MTLKHITVLLLFAVIAWWLSGYDVKVTGDSKKRDLMRRSIRCCSTILLVELAFQALWRLGQHLNEADRLMYLPVLLPLAIVWAGCVLMLWRGCFSEWMARKFHGLIDAEDDREFDPMHDERELDAIADLIRKGRKEEAIKLCRMLKQREDANIPVLEMTLEYLGIPQQRGKKSGPLTEAYQLRTEGKFQEAESILNSLIVENPRNLEVAMMLMRLYAQDLRRMDKATEVLQRLERQAQISPAYIDYARRSIVEWSNRKPERTVVEAQPESIDGLLAEKYFGTAIEILEQKIAEQPQDFELRLKCAEVHAVHCNNIDRAVKIARDIETSGNFSPEQIQTAKTKLVEWRKIWPRYN